MARLSRTGGKTDNVKTRKPKPRKASPAEGRTTAKTKAIRASSAKAKGAKAKPAKTNPAKARTAKTKIADTKRRVAPAATPRALAHISDLLTELKEIREQQAATAEILKVINASPGDLTPVFEVILDKTHHLCDVASGSLQLFEDGQVQTVATRGFNERWKQYLRQGYKIDDSNREALETDLPRHVADMREVLDRSANGTSRAFVEIGGFRTLLGLPLLKDGKAIG